MTTTERRSSNGVFPVVGNGVVVATQKLNVDLLVVAISSRV